jgi:putative hydrolase of the HAD superfamily
MIKAVIFDLDGVIVISNQRFSDRLGLNQELQDEFFKGKFLDLLVGKGDLKEEIRKYAEKWGWKGTIEELLEYWFRGEHVMDKRVVSAIRELRKNGIKTFLATNQEKYRTAYVKKEMGLLLIFDEIFSSSSAGYMKKDPQFWQFVLERIPVKPKEVLYWDDSGDNVEAAGIAGVRAELYTSFEDFHMKMQTMKMVMQNKSLVTS